jgi:hypothetical protein
MPKNSLSTKLRKLEGPFTQQKGLHHQDHASMNALILNNILSKFPCNEQKVIT